MLRSLFVLGVCCGAAAPTVLLAQEAVAVAPQPAPRLQSIRMTGAKELGEPSIRDALRVNVGQPFVDTVEQVASRLESAYHDEGFTFARVKADFDVSSGALTLTIDEGVIAGVEFQGVDEALARTFASEFALRAGDVFNSRRARQALDVLLQPTRGAVSAGHARATTFTDSADLRRRHGTFDLVDRDGQRVLVVGLREPAARFRLLPDPGEREDWFSPVDGFVPSFGMGIAVFDHERFNHTYVAGHLSYKTAAARAGYALGFERPLFGETKVYIGGELHDLTASDDQWQVSSLEASVDALGPRRNYRDYYRRRGVQVNAAVRVHPQVEVLFAWRGEREAPLATTSDFSFWNNDDAFRPNVAARDGRLNAVLIGASVDGRSFDRESLGATYRRHQLETPFGAQLNQPEGKNDVAPIWRIDWMSEMSAPGAFGSDFDFRRHIVSGRARTVLSEHQSFGVRAIGGWSEGILPPQREFSVGGIGSVHGYDFKEQVGDTLALLNLEYELGWRNGVKLIGFYDIGRATLRQPAGSLLTGAASPWLKGVGWGIGLGELRVDFGYKVDAVPSSLQLLVRLGRTF